MTDPGSILAHESNGAGVVDGFLAVDSAGRLRVFDETGNCNECCAHPCVRDFGHLPRDFADDFSSGDVSAWKGSHNTSVVAGKCLFDVNGTSGGFMNGVAVSSWLTSQVLRPCEPPYQMSFEFEISTEIFPTGQLSSYSSGMGFGIQRIYSVAGTVLDFGTLLFEGLQTTRFTQSTNKYRNQLGIRGDSKPMPPGDLQVNLIRVEMSAPAANPRHYDFEIFANGTSLLTGSVLDVADSYLQTQGTASGVGDEWLCSFFPVFWATKLGDPTGKAQLDNVTMDFSCL